MPQNFNDIELQETHYKLIFLLHLGQILWVKILNKTIAMFLNINLNIPTILFLKRVETKMTKRQIDVKNNRAILLSNNYLVHY